MRLHLRHNGVESVTLEPYALASEVGTASLSVVVDGFTTMNSLRTPALDQITREVNVETVTLDESFVASKLTELTSSRSTRKAAKWMPSAVLITY